MLIQNDDGVYIKVSSLISMLRTLQYERYATPSMDREYVCVEGVIDSINTLTERFCEGGLEENF